MAYEKLSLAKRNRTRKNPNGPIKTSSTWPMPTIVTPGETVLTHDARVDLPGAPDSRVLERGVRDRRREGFAFAEELPGPAYS